MRRRTPRSTLFPYTTLFRSVGKRDQLRRAAARRAAVRRRQRDLHAGRADADARDVLQLVLRAADRSEEHTSELQSLTNLVCRLLLEKKKEDTSKRRAELTPF